MNKIKINENNYNNYLANYRMYKDLHENKKLWEEYVHVLEILNPFDIELYPHRSILPKRIDKREIRSIEPDDIIIGYFKRKNLRNISDLPKL